MATFDSTQQASAFEIRALAGVGDLVKAGQKFDLVGRGLPFRGASFEVIQRIQTTWYPGNPVANQQVTGPTLSNTTINGVWRDRYVGDTSTPAGKAQAAVQGLPGGDGTAALLVRQFETLCEFAVPVEVRWGSGYVEGLLTGAIIVRRGLIKRFKATYDRPQDIVWEMEFEWRGREEDAAKPVTVRLTDARDQLAQASTALSDASQQVQDFQSAEKPLLFKIPGAIDSSLDDLITTLGGFSEQLSDQVAGVVGGIHADGGLLDHGSALAAIGIMQGSVNTLQKGIEQLEALPIYLLDVKDAALDLLSSIGGLLNLKQDLGATQQNLQQVAADLQGQLFQGVLAEVQAPAGLDLRDLALEYYGDPDLWFTIAHYNGLTSSRVPDNPTGPSDVLVTTIKIPKQPGVVSGVGSVC